MNGILLLHYWECQIAVMCQKPMERPSSQVGLLIQTSLCIRKILFMSRVLKPFYSTAVSLFCSLIKIATDIYFPIQFHFDCISKFYSVDQQNQLEVNCRAFHKSFSPQVLNKGSKNGYCFSNVCFILKYFFCQV